MKYGFSDKQLKEIIDIIAAYDEIETAVLFGSRVMDTYKEASDVDIAIKGQQADLNLAARLKDHFEEETWLPFFFDVIAWNTITSADLKKQIRTRGKVIYRKNMREWRECSLSDFAEINMGQSPKSEFYNTTGDGLPFLQGNRTFGIRHPSIDTYCTNTTKIAEKNSVLLSVRAPVGDINIADKKICIGRGLASLNTKSGENIFLFYLLKFLHNIILKSETGTIFGSINKTDLGSIKISRPSFSEQKAIASVLSSLDDKIDLLHRQNKTLESLAETLFRHWFVEEAKEDWDSVRISDVANVTIGRTPPRKEKEWFSEGNEDMKWVSIKDMGADGVYLDKTSECLTCAAVKKFKIPIIPAGTTILSFKMTVGRVAITSEDMLSNEAIAHFNIKNRDVINSEFLYIFFKKFNFDQLGTTSSIVTAINSRMIKDLPLVLPDRKTFGKFREAVQPYFKKIRANQKQIRTLEKLRDTLLPKLMSGEVRVKH